MTMRKLFLYVLFACVALTPSCKYLSFHSKAAVVAATPLAPAASATDTALEKANSEHTALVAKTRANLQTARKQNATQPAGNATTIVEGELGVADQRLSGTPVDATEALASANREALVQSGKASEARSAYEKANTDAKADAARAAAAETDAKLARQHEKDTIKAYEDKIAADVAATSAKITSLKNAEANGQAKWLRWAAGGCLAIFLLGIGFGQIAGAKIVWPFGAASLLLFGLAQIVQEAWFRWATGGAIGILGVITGWWVWQHYKQGNLLVATQDKATKLKAVTTAVVPVLDKAYTDAEQPIKDWLDAHVFSKLNSTMDASTKATVHEVRAAEEVK